MHFGQSDSFSVREAMPVFVVFSSSSFYYCCYHIINFTVLALVTCYLMFIILYAGVTRWLFLFVLVRLVRLLSRRQTIDKLGQLFGCGLVSKDNRLAKSLNHDTCHLSGHGGDDKQMADDKDADAFMLIYFLTAKQHKNRTVWVRRWLLDSRHVSNLLIVHFIGQLSLETKPCPKSWPTLSII